MKNKNMAFLLAMALGVLSGNSYAQSSSAEYDDLYFDGVEQVVQKKSKKEINSSPSEYDDEVIENNTVAENNYKEYRAGDNYEPYDYEYSSRVRRFHNSAPGFSYYSDYYVDQYYYDPYYGGTSIYIVSGPSYWSGYQYYRPWWMRRYYNPWSCPNSYNSFGWGGGWGSYSHGYNNGFWDGYYAAGGGYRPWWWRRNNVTNNGYYAQATPSAANYVTDRFTRGSNTGRSTTNTTLHSSSNPYDRGNAGNYSGPRNGTNTDGRGNAYSRPEDGRTNRYGTPNTNTTTTTGDRNGYSRDNTNTSPNNNTISPSKDRDNSYSRDGYNNNTPSRNYDRNTTPSKTTTPNRTTTPSYNRSTPNRSTTPSRTTTPSYNRSTTPRSSSSTPSYNRSSSNSSSRSTTPSRNNGGRSPR